MLRLIDDDVYDPTVLTLEDIAQVAGEHLTPDMLDRWLPLVRPSIRLTHAEPGDPVVARIGGDPHLPAGTPWPTSPAAGPLNFLLDVDLDALTRLGLTTDLNLPTTGHLLAFYCEAPEDLDDWLDYQDPATQATAQLIYHTRAAADCPATDAPEPLAPYEPIDLTAHQVHSVPSAENPYATAAVLGPDARPQLGRSDNPFLSLDFRDAVRELNGPGPLHRIGGWPDNVQGPVEIETAIAATGLDHDDPTLLDHARRQRLLLQIEADSDMSLGDLGTIYWTIPDTPDPIDPTTATATWQST